MRAHRTLVAIVLCACGHSGSSVPPDPDGPPGDTGIYAAYATIGGLDHLRIAKIFGGTCFAIDLIRPSSSGMGLTLPAGWGTVGGRALQPNGACDPSYLGPIENQFAATSQSGAIAWSSAAIVDSISVTLQFANAPAWCPRDEPIVATNIAVQ